ncbi:Acetoin:2,6-dichlorophenolindophenol oxidoreductase subunit alpha [Cardinium endosymbiont of Culicoides punctatus]|nr:Acetoin:2,6-dichlorophenolindophenol oxidoreductase subunit alpha [Cardinium endosymbiont of Culicoides punctatus]
MVSIKNLNTTMSRLGAIKPEQEGTCSYTSKVDLSPFYLGWYETMLLIRRFEDKAAQLYGQQKIKGFCHLYNGQEACVAGAVTALRKEDKYITAYRDHAHPIALGTDPKYIMAELYGKSTGISKGYGGSMHLFDKEHHFFGGHAIVGGQIPLGVGIAFAEKYNKTDNLCIAFMGDGAVRQGAVHEAFNLAMLYSLPIIFVIENNGYSMGTSLERSSNVTALYQIGAGYNMDAKQVDGLCVEDVHGAVQDAAEKARKGIPNLLEFVTYRYRGHSMSDPANYRTKEEVESYKDQDPILKIQRLILEKKVGNESDLSSINDRVKAKIAEAINFAETSPFPDPATVYHYIYKQDNYPFLQN